MDCAEGGVPLELLPGSKYPAVAPPVGLGARHLDVLAEAVYQGSTVPAHRGCEVDWHLEVRGGRGGRCGLRRVWFWEGEREVKGGGGVSWGPFNDNTL